MSKDKKNLQVVPEVAPVSTPVETNAPVTNTAPTQPVGPKLSEMDKMRLDLAKQKRATVLAEAKTALAQNEAAEALFNNLVLQLFMSYGLTQNDTIAEDGTIMIGGAVQSDTK